MKASVLWFAMLVFLTLVSVSARAEYTSTLPSGMFLLDSGVYLSNLSNAYDDSGNLGPLIAPIERYEPGGGLQGTLSPEVDVDFCVLVSQIQYGITDFLTLGVGIPVVMYTDIDVEFDWEPGDYQAFLGRPYSEQDFWEWAASMGQPKPEDWRGNEGVPSDVVIGLRYRFSDHIDWFERSGLGMALMAFGAVETSTKADPEELVSTGTTLWDLHSQGQLGFHLGIDKFFKDSLDGRLVVGVDFFYEFLFESEYITPAGEKHPLLLNFKSYVGETYTLDPGDFMGASLQVDVVPVKGHVLSAWLVGGDMKRAQSLPPLLSLSLQYTHTRLGQSDWKSDSEIWDWEKEKIWRPGYKNTLFGKATLSLLRLGVPLQLYVAYRNQTLIPGKNSRAANVLVGGLQIPVKFW